MRPLRVGTTLAALLGVAAAALHAQPTPSFAGASSASTDTLRAAAAPAPGDSLGMPRASAARPRSAVVMRDANSVLSRRTDDSTQDENVVGALRIESVSDGADYVVLQDGTRWKVALADRPRVEQWKAGDWVMVRLAPIAEGRDYDYRLVNGRDESNVLVAFRGMAQSSD